MGQTNSVLTVSTPGNYTARRLIGGSCLTESILVEPGHLVVSSFANTFPLEFACEGEAIDAYANGADTYTWSPAVQSHNASQDTVVILPDADVVYIVTGTRGSCTGTDTLSFPLVPVPDLTVTVEDDTVCPGQSVHVSVSGGNLTEPFYWTAAGPSLFTTAEGDLIPFITTTYHVYQLAGEDFGCYSHTPFTITVTGLDEPMADTVLCAGSTAILTASGGDSYVWQPAAGLNTTSGPEVEASPSGTTIYTVSTHVDGCAVVDTFVVNVLPLPEVSVNNASVCPGEPAVLTASGAAEYTWSPASGLNVTTGAVVNATPAATTVYTLIGTANGCPDTTHATVIITPGLTITAGDAEICPGTIAPVSPAGADNYTWSPPAGLILSGGVVTGVSPPATTTYTITGTTGGCTGFTTVTVTVKPDVAITVNDAAICPGFSAGLQAAGATDYVWSPPAGLHSTTGSNVIASPATSTAYTVIGTANGCSDTVEAVVTVTPGLPLSVNDFEICAGGTAVLTATGAFTYEWSPAVTFFQPDGSTVHASPTETTVYTVTGINADSTCSGSATATVELISGVAVSISASPNPALASNPLVSFSGEPSNAFLIWGFGEGDSTEAAFTEHLFPLDSEAVYTVALIVRTAGGCIDTAFVQIIVENGDAYYVPNAFTPNGDEHNNTFKPVFATGFSRQEFLMRIYNRWGELVFETTDPANGWDGTFRGQEAPPGAYTWTITAGNVTNAGVTGITGSVMLMR